MNDIYNKEELPIYFARGNDRIQCSCGKVFFKTSIKAHNNTKYHIKYVGTLPYKNVVSC